MTAQNTIHTTFSLKGINVLDIKSFVVFFLDYISTFFFRSLIRGAVYCDRLHITWLIIFLHHDIHNRNKVVFIDFSNLLKWHFLVFFKLYLEHFNLNLSRYKLDSNYNVIEFANHKTSTYNITFFFTCEIYIHCILMNHMFFWFRA